eukprot:jgi/Tetstr1/441262/TSEL_029513.t1
MFAHSADSDAESDKMGVLDPVTIAQIVAEEEESVNDLSRRICNILLLGARDLQWGDPDDDFDPMDYFVVPEDGGGRRQGGRDTARGPLEGSLAWDEFRFKFRVPWPMFNWLLQQTRASKLFPDETLKKAGNPPAPLGLKLAAALRMLALGIPVDGIEDSSDLSKATLGTFMFGMDMQEGKKQTVIGWFRWFVRTFQPVWIQAPQTQADVQKQQRIFARCGFPGAVSSQDAVHNGGYDNAPASERANMVGKQGYPTLAWNVNVGHQKLIFSVHGPFAGGRNDKTIVRDDPFISEYDGLNTIGERDDDWEPLELDAFGGTASAAVEMINEQMRMDANPEDLPTDLVDSDVGQCVTSM